MHKPTKIHQEAAKHVLRYLADTIYFGIFYQGCCNYLLQGFSSSDQGLNPVDIKGPTSVVFNMGSGTITWLSKKQDIVALSSTEVEYIALSVTCCQGIWLKRILEDCGIKHDDTITINCDNTSCIVVAKNLVLHGRTKHKDVKFNFIRDLVPEKQ